MTGEFLEKLLNKSKIFKLWLEASDHLAFCIDNWNEMMASDQEKAIEVYSSLAHVGLPELVNLAREFYTALQDQLNHDQRHNLSEAIFVKSFYGNDIRGRQEQIQRDQQMNQLFVHVDWDQIFP